MIGINQRIPINILELALRAALSGEGTREYFSALAGTEYNGPNRIAKAVSVINRLTIKNQLWQYMKDNAETLLNSMSNKNNRPMVFAAIISGAYNFGFDTLLISGKFLHTLDELPTLIIKNKLAEKYGTNRSLHNAFNSVMPMFIEAGFIDRPVPGIIKIKSQTNFSEFAIDLYKQSFLINQAVYTANDDFMSNPYFEYIRQ